MASIAEQSPGSVDFGLRPVTSGVAQLVNDRFPGVGIESEIQGWAYLERFEDGLAAYAAIPEPTAKDDRWAGVCYFQTFRDTEALRVLRRAASRGDEGARFYLAHVLRFVDDGGEAAPDLTRIDLSTLNDYDTALYYRILSLERESIGRLQEAMQAAESAWRKIQGIPEYKVLAPSILVQLAVLYARIGRSQLALWFLERSLIGSDTGEQQKIRLRIASVLINLGRYREAQTALESPRLAEAPAEYQPERNWLLGEIAWANNSLNAAVQQFVKAYNLAADLQFAYEEFLSRLSLVCILGVRGEFNEAFEHLTRAQALIADKSDRLLFRFREVMLNYWARRYTRSHALLEFEGLIKAFEEMGLMQEQAAVQLHYANLLRLSGTDGWQRQLDELNTLSISLQNQALLSREWTLLPELRQIAYRTHPRIAGTAVKVFEVFTLGDERLLLDDEPVQIPLRRGVELVAYFLEHKAVSLKDVLQDVFPEERQSAAKSYFHQFRHQLREAVEGVEIEYDSESKLYRLKSELEVSWDVTELRAGRVMGETGAFLPSSKNEWAKKLDASLDELRLNARKY